MAYEQRLIDIEQAKRATYEEIFWTESEQAVVRNFLAKLPKVDAVEVVHGRWVHDGYRDEYFCSNCYKQPISFRREMNCGVGELVEVCFSDYCPNCGAKMDGGDEGGK